MQINAKVQEALRHIQSLFPEVTQVFYGADGRWQYLDDEFEAPLFGDEPVDVSLLEDAANAAEEEKGFPCAYALLQEEQTQGNPLQQGSTRLPCETNAYWVVYSPNESAVSREDAGFWSDELGWVPFYQARLYSTAETESAQLPWATGGDARFVRWHEAQDHYGVDPVAELSTFIQRALKDDILRLQDIPGLLARFDLV